MDFAIPSEMKERMKQFKGVLAQEVTPYLSGWYRQVTGTSA